MYFSSLALLQVRILGLFFLHLQLLFGFVPISCPRYVQLVELTKETDYYKQLAEKFKVCANVCYTYLLKKNSLAVSKNETSCKMDKVKNF